jgi:aldehyde:ferredoxin oxidoreductase
MFLRLKKAISYHLLADTIDRLGLDANESGWLISFTMECYERGIISKKDTDGLEMTWGNVEAARELLHKIAKKGRDSEMFWLRA